MPDNSRRAPDGKRLRRFRTAAIRTASDALLVAVALSVAVAAISGFRPVRDDYFGFAISALVATAILTAGIAAAGAYRAADRGLDSGVAWRLAAGLAAGALVAIAVIVAAHLPLLRREIVIGAALSFGALCLSRVRLPARRANRRQGSAVPTLVIGSRDAARAVIRLAETRGDVPYAVIGCVDDDEDASAVEGIPVLGAIDDLSQLIQRFGASAVIIASSSPQAGLVKRIHRACAGAVGAGGKQPTVLVLPNLAELLSGSVKASRVREVRLDDLLRRVPLDLDTSSIVPHLENKVVLVTGAGGSIGSELCRQITRFNPKLLVLLGHGENSLFAIDRELRADFGFTRSVIVLADVADGSRISAVFARYRPHVVFHAAAHKHVPILESNACEAVRNNVFGTQVVALAAAAAGVAKFVLVSTDKAVNPTSVMGATKRVAELICQSMERRTPTEFVSVRFGNVLGSRGSVLDVFKKQIDAGGPLTITHPEMERFFMTIPEAVGLVLEAMAIGRDGHVFVMNMGEPVSVVELAETLVSLSGLRPYEDIDIVFTGMRPGEKLREELLTTGEGQNPTIHERLYVAQQERMDYEVLGERLDELKLAVATPDPQAVIAGLSRLVPSFLPGPHWSNGARDELGYPDVAAISINGHPAGDIAEIDADAVLTDATEVSHAGD